MSRRSSSRRWLAGALFGAFAISAGRAEEIAAPSIAEAIADEVRTVFEKCRKAVVKIEATDRHGRLSGSGFFIDPNGTLYTSYTIGGESRDMVVSNESMRFSVHRLVADARSGVALLKAETETPSFLTIGRSNELSVASPVMSIGYPMGLPSSPSFGTIGGFDLRYLTRMFVTTHVRANVPVQRGEGGAPLLNMRGEVVGLTIASVDSGSARFVLPIEAAEKVRRDYLRFGQVRPGWIGITVAPAEKPVSGSNVLIESLIEDAPAIHSGIEVGDVVLRIGNRNVARPEDVVDASFFITAEDEVTVRVARANIGELEFTIQAAAHPALQPPKSSDLHPALRVLGATQMRGEQPLKIDR